MMAPERINKIADILHQKNLELMAMYLQSCEVAISTSLAQALDQLLLSCLLLPQVSKGWRQAVCGQHLRQFISAGLQPGFLGPDV